MSARQPGTVLLALARRLCSPQCVEAVALPIVADLQFEAERCACRPLLVRGWTRSRGCLVFGKAMALAVVLGYWRNPMDSKPVGWLRLLLAIPAALVITLAVQFVTARLFGSVLVHPGPRLANGVVLVEGINLVKVLSAPLMAAAFFWTMYLVAPRSRRPPVALGSLVVIGLWGALMIAGSFLPRPSFHPFLLGIGLAGWLGGGLSYWIAKRSSRAFVTGI